MANEGEPGAVETESALSCGSKLRLEVSRTWDGLPADDAERAVLDLSFTHAALELEVRAPFHDDPPPPHPPGACPGLWAHEVVELFLLGEGERYLEIELGPRGHHLVLDLQGRRCVVREGLPLEVHASIEGGLWHATAAVPNAYLPPGLRAANAYAIHGVGATRRYLAAYPVPGEHPDFHRLERFAPLGVLEA